MAVNKRKIVLITMIVLLLCEIGFYYGVKYNAEQKKNIIVNDLAVTTDSAVTIKDNEKVVFYIYDNKTNYLKKSEENIEKTSHQNEKIKRMFQVLRDKSGDNFNKNAEVINVFFENGGVVYLNLNRDFLTPTFSDEVKQYTLYSVVNTICDLGYSKVKFMIENEDVEKLGNSIGAMDAFSKDALLIKGE